MFDYDMLVAHALAIKFDLLNVSRKAALDIYKADKEQSRKKSKNDLGKSIQHNNEKLKPFRKHKNTEFVTMLTALGQRKRIDFRCHHPTQYQQEHINKTLSSVDELRSKTPCSNKEKRASSLAKNCGETCDKKRYKTPIAQIRESRHQHSFYIEDVVSREKNLRFCKKPETICIID
ncbi:unnamed protein product [Mytilus edulis]|uniref:Uncharacterized protein n=1 Tax=Mytilus edulis TaxID=6550 RepID=A0A8S3TW89_MYTED|nr:unnamed protein product [Mytilus edulis]